VVCLAGWAALTLISLGLLANSNHLPLLVRDLNSIGRPLITVAAFVGAGAVACAALALRRARIAPRLGLAVAIPVGLLLLATMVESIATGNLAEVPQFLPLVAALLLGIGLVLVRAPERS
jgi:hypothetical protein